MTSLLHDRLLDRSAVIELTSLSYATIHRGMQAGTFPRAVKISKNRVAWPASSIDAWLKSKMEAA